MKNETFTTNPSFDEIKHLLSDKILIIPWKRKTREDIEDEIDLKVFEDRQDEPGEPWSDVKKELGLD